MKIGKLANANSKGQFVIPQEYRESLGITPDVTLNIYPKYNGLFIEPIKDVVPSVSTEDIYGDVLAATQGSWGRLRERSKQQKKEELELEESKRRKQEW